MTTTPGLRIESAASVVARDMIQNHVRIFAHVIRTDRAANQSTVAAYIDGLAGVMALTIAGGHGSRNEVLAETIIQITRTLERDLRHLAAK